MSTKRRPINPPPCIRFTHKAIAIFKRMIEDDCEGEEYDKLGRELRHELKLTPGESYPILVFPRRRGRRPYSERLAARRRLMAAIDRPQFFQ
jgi:hypothetical protein